MEKSIESGTIKLTIKMNGEKTANDPLSPDRPVKVEDEACSPNLPKSSPAAKSHEQIDVSSPGEVENPDTKEEEENLRKIVVYDHEGINDNEYPNGDQTRLVPRKRQSSTLCIGTFTIQCSNCFKWRIVPTKEKYEEFRENIIKKPFFCQHGKEWNPELSCDEPPDITQDGSRIWAIDRPNIPRPPHGWERLLKFRGEGSSKFADVYYVAPWGMRFRSMVQLQRYLDENPNYKEQGISKSQFSFQIPKPLQEDYVRKRSAASDNGIMGSAEVTEVQPISWISPEGEIESQINGLGSSSYDDTESPENAETRMRKKRKVSSKKSDEDLQSSNQNDVDV